MTRLSRIFIIVLAVGVMAAYLPDLFWKALDRKVHRPYILYSAENDHFIYRVSDGFGHTFYRDEHGGEYDRIAFEKMAPFFYSSDLNKWGELPEEVCGVYVDMSIIRHHRQFLVVRPYYLHTPQIDLFPLFESQSQFARLEFPPEMFRLDSRMEFIDAASNTVNEQLSAKFTDALAGAGFTFPARYLAGNPTTRKAFDEGYFAVDDAGRIFHIKKVEGEPWIRDTGLAPESGVRYIQVKENGLREFYGWMITGDGDIHLITYEDYALVTLPVPGYAPDRMTIQLWTDPLNRTLTYYDVDEDVIHVVTTDRKYDVVRTYDYQLERSRTEASETLAGILFPFDIVTESSKTDYVLFDLELGGLLALAGIAASLVLLALLRFRFRDSGRDRSPAGLKNSWIDFIIVALTGFYGLVSVIVIGREPPRK